MHDVDDDLSIVEQLRQVQKPIQFSIPRKKLEDELQSDWDTLVLEASENCNLRCGYCKFGGTYESDRTHSEQLKNMDFTTAMKAFNIFSQHASSTPHLSYFGGEPLLNMDLIMKMLSPAKDKLPNITFNLTSNMLLAYAYAKELVENNILLAASIDGPKKIQDAFRHMKNGNGSFDLVMRAMNKFAELNEDYYKTIVLMVTLSDPSKMLELREFFAKYFPQHEMMITGVDTRWSTQKLSTYTPEKIKQFTEIVGDLAREYVSVRKSGKTAEQVDPFLRGYFRQIEVDIRKHNVGPLPENGKIYPTGACIPGKRKLYTSVDGLFHVCERIGRQMVIGDVENGLEMDMSNNHVQNYVNYRNIVCDDCWNQRQCGICYVGSLGKEDISLEGTRLYCPSAKDRTLLGLSIVSTIDGGNPNVSMATS
ncbi:MAG: radical SAM protein [Nanoarchaeota archaeon]